MDPYQFNCFFPPEFVYYPNLSLLPDQQTLSSPNNQLSQLNEKLQEKYRLLEREKDKLAQENKELKKMIRPKRKYSKRRDNLRREYKCPHNGCSRQYSSSIALNSHLKKKHKQVALPH